MGVYDTYANVQLKIGPCELKHYNIGDAVPILDGIYVGYEGIVVIKNCIFVAVFKELGTKWGTTIDMDDTLNMHNPIYARK